MKERLREAKQRAHCYSYSLIKRKVCTENMTFYGPMWCLRNKSAGVSLVKADNTIVRSIAECDYKSRHLAQNRPLRKFVAVRSDRENLTRQEYGFSRFTYSYSTSKIYIETCDLKKSKCQRSKFTQKSKFT